MPRVCAVAVLACCLCVPTQARADPITISGGALTSVGILGSISFTLTGDGFSVVGGQEAGFAGPSLCSPCVAGDSVIFNARFVGEFTLGSGPATVSGVSYSKVYYAGVLAFEAGARTFPSGSSTVELASPFMLSSDPADQSFLEGFLTSNLEGPSVFRVDLTGRGVATATYHEGPTPGLFDFRQVTYAFLSPEPVPEPSTVLLVVTGLIGAGVRQWGRRKTWTSS